MDVAGQLAFFVRTVDEGSLSAAARSLDVSPSAVSKQLRRLEDRLELRLLNRTTRRLTLTDEGRVIYERCVRITAAIEEIDTLAVTLSGKVVGTLHVAATVAFAKAQLMALIPGFLDRHPGLSLEIEMTDRPIDLVAEGVDVAIRFTEQLDGTNLVARRLARNRRVVCAAPAYLAAHGVPETPDDLTRHNCLRLSTVSRWNEWEFEDGARTKMLHVRGNFSANSADAIYRAALAGIGVARLSTFLVAADLRAGTLVHLLPEFTHDKADILAVYPERRNLSPKVRAFIDYLVEQLGPVPPWERDPAP